MRRRLLISGTAIAITALTLAGCSSNDSGNGMGDGMGSGTHHHTTATKNAPRTAGQFRLDEWTITADADQLPAGSQKITALNTGNHTHELVIFKADDIAALPKKSDGSVDENALQAAKVGEIADVASGSSKHATFDLAPGTYVALCNIIDTMGMGGMNHNHFDLGMHTTFTVNP